MPRTKLYSTALLPTKTKVGLGDAEANKFVEPSDVIYVMEQFDPNGNGMRPNVFRAWKSSGELHGDAWYVGSCHVGHHDQTGRELGHFKVIGVFRFVGGEPMWEGRRPLKKMPLYVFK